METWSGTLHDHGTRYPRMEPRDAVKLAYQSEFAGGHLIRDRRESLARLKTELAGVRPRPGAPRAGAEQGHLKKKKPTKRTRRWG